MEKDQELKVLKEMNELQDFADETSRGSVETGAVCRVHMSAQLLLRFAVDGWYKLTFPGQRFTI